MHAWCVHVLSLIFCGIGLGGPRNPRTPQATPMPSFSFYTASPCRPTFYWGGQWVDTCPSKVSLPLRNLDSQSAFKQHFDRFSRFSKAYDHDEQTEQAIPFVAIGRIYAMRPKMLIANEIAFSSNFLLKNYFRPTSLFQFQHCTYCLAH